MAWRKGDAVVGSATGFGWLWMEGGDGGGVLEGARAMEAVSRGYASRRVQELLSSKGNWRKAADDRAALAPIRFGTESKRLDATVMVGLIVAVTFVDVCDGHWCLFCRACACSGCFGEESGSSVHTLQLLRCVEVASAVREFLQALLIRICYFWLNGSGSAACARCCG